MLAAYKARVRGLHLAAVRLEARVARRTRELEIAKEAAECANNAKSTFLATMSHELRTPLNAILGFSAMVRDSPDLRDEHRKSLQIVNRSGENLLSLIDDVLDTAKIEAGRMTLEERNFDVTSLVRDNIDMMRARAGNKALELFFESSLTMPQFVRADAGKLRQVLINLLGNAVKFTERGSVTVRLNVSRMDSKPMDDHHRTMLVLEVEDTGIGIAEEDQAHIFDVFVQAGGTSTQKGTGLGLYITQRLVQLMGGTISIRSAPGQGSVFRVELPVEQVQASAVTADYEHGQVLGLAPGQPECRVLIVEDKKENWLFLQRLLLDAGFQVQVAEDGLQAVEMYRTWQPHLIWMDVRLPMLGGLTATARIRALDGGGAVRIVGLSASAFAHEQKDVLAAGMDDFLRKPFRREEIFDVMARQLGIRYSYGQEQRVRGADPCLLFQGDLSTLPQELRDDLANAVLRLESMHIREVIDRVAQHDSQLGEVLSRAAERLEYTPILKALERSNARLRA
jgi:signal transduction histidine kinase/CheY-like chemotaxis protein